MASNKEMRKIERDARKCGFNVERTKSGHYRISRGKDVIIIPFSPGSAASERDGKVRYQRFKEAHGG